jgi:flagellar biosynthesis regulator FlbT
MVHLMIFVETEMRSQIENRLRRVLDSLCQRFETSSVVVFLTAIQAEVGKLGSEHRIRSLFERALKSNKK